MTAEKFKAYRSRPFYELGRIPFTHTGRYEQDASNIIARGALLGGDLIILGELKRSGIIYYWLPDEDGYGITHRFDDIGEDAKRIFTRIRDNEQVSLKKSDVRKLIIQRKLSNKQINKWGNLYNVPEKEVVEKIQKNNESSSIIYTSL